jgi:CUB domain
MRIQVYPTIANAFLPAPLGHLIRIDFRSEFYIEYSDDCSYDYIEFRDGPWGFSPLLGRYCGRRRPPTVVSTGRWMWIEFKSDDSVQYSGFHAVYEVFNQAGGFIEILFNKLYFNEV